MDSAEKLTILSFCTGYAGLDLGIRRVLGDRLRGVAACEIEAFAVANLLAKMESGLMDPMPVWTNLKTFPSREFHGLVDILVAGFPCQPFAASGQKRATEDPRHLFPFIDKIIGDIEPSAVFLENVEGILNCKCRNQPGARDGEPVLLYVLRCLEKRGYEATWGLFSAREVGAPHKRMRVFMLGRRRDRDVEWGRFCPGLADAQGWKPGEPEAWDRRENAGRGGQEGGKPQALVDAESLQPRAGQQHAGADRVGQGGQGGGEPSEGMADSAGSRRHGRPRQEQHVRGQPLQAARLAGRREMGGVHAGAEDLDGGGERRLGDPSHGVFQGMVQRGDRGLLWPSRPGERQHFWEPPRNLPKSKGRASLRGVPIEPRLGRTLDGSPSWLVRSVGDETTDRRVDRLRLIGNAVVPAVAETAWRELWRRMVGEKEETLFG